MSFITVENVKVLQNPARFQDELNFEITFECVAPGIKHELEWKLVYVGSAEDEKYDQELDAVMVGPVAIGKNKFVFTAPAPDSSKIPVEDLLDVTVILLTCSYQEHEFIRIGYYINNEMELTPEQQQQIKALHDAADQNNTPVDEAAVEAIRGPIRVEKIWRNILEDKPRVTRFNIPWDKPQEQFPELTDEEKQRLEASAAMEADDKSQDTEQKEQQQNGSVVSSTTGFTSTGGEKGSDSKEVDDEAMDEDELDEEGEEGEESEMEEDLGSEDTDAAEEGEGIEGEEAEETEQPATAVADNNATNSTATTQ